MGLSFLPTFLIELYWENQMTENSFETSTHNIKSQIKRDLDTSYFILQLVLKQTFIQSYF